MAVLIAMSMARPPVSSVYVASAHEPASVHDQRRTLLGPLDEGERTAWRATFGGGDRVARTDVRRVGEDRDALARADPEDLRARRESTC